MQTALQDMMQSLVGIVRTEPEMQQAVVELDSCEGARQEGRP